MTDKLTPFEFIKAASQSKKDLIGDNDYPEMAEKQYTAFIVNRGFSYFEDTILHANEMNQRAHLFDRAQFDYYRGALRTRNRFSKWHKAEKNGDLDVIQEVYQCSRIIAKMYLKALSSDQMKEVHTKLAKGG